MFLRITNSGKASIVESVRHEGKVRQRHLYPCGNVKFKDGFTSSLLRARKHLKLNEEDWDKIKLRAAPWIEERYRRQIDGPRDEYDFHPTGCMISTNSEKETANRERVMEKLEVLADRRNMVVYFGEGLWYLDHDGTTTTYRTVRELLLGMVPDAQIIRSLLDIEF